MAFPTSGLVNNQVHKESNRSFVYDSTLTVWNQLRDAPDTISILEREQSFFGFLDNVTLGSSVVFPAGHVVQVKQYTSTASHATSSSHNTWQATSILKAVTPKTTTSRFLVELSAMGSSAGDTWLRTGMKATGSSISTTAFGADDATPLSRSSPSAAGVIVRVTWSIIVDVNQSNTTDEIEFRVWMNTGTSGTAGYLGSRSGVGATEGWTFLTVTEIA